MRSVEFLDYLPTPQTPGFGLASPRIFQVLMALVHHAIKFGTAPEPSSVNPSSTRRPKVKPLSPGADKNGESTKPSQPKAKRPRQANRRRPSKKPEEGGSKAQAPILQAAFTVGQLARACGCNRNTAGAALKELVILGWISKSRERHSGGEFGGFRYRLCVPPTVLTKAAAHLYTSRLDQSEDRLDQLRQRIKDSATPLAEQDDNQPTSTPPGDEESDNSEPTSTPDDAEHEEVV